jgi:hypothetical protein
MKKLSWHDLWIFLERLRNSSTKVLNFRNQCQDWYYNPAHQEYNVRAITARPDVQLVSSGQEMEAAVVPKCWYLVSKILYTACVWETVMLVFVLLLWELKISFIWFLCFSLCFLQRFVMSYLFNNRMFFYRYSNSILPAFNCQSCYEDKKSQVNEYSARSMVVWRYKVCVTKMKELSVNHECVQLQLA